MYTPRNWAIVLASVAGTGRASAADAPGAGMDDSVLIIWILAGIFVFFALVLGFTWRIVKTERNRVAKKESGGIP